MPADTLLETKAFGALEIKDAEKGEVTALVNTLGIVDRDGDVILPGAIPDGTPVKMSAYGHDVVLDGAAPAGKGVLRINGNQVLFYGQFFLSTHRGRDAFETQKALGTESDWSLGYLRSVKTGDLTEEWRAKGARRVIAELKALEVSPVLIGANPMTGTLTVKASEETAPKPEEPPPPEEPNPTPPVESEAPPPVEPEPTPEPELDEAALAEAKQLEAIREATADEFERFQRTMRKFRAA